MLKTLYCQLYSALYNHPVIGIITGFFSSLLSMLTKTIPFLQYLGIVVALLIAVLTAYLTVLKIRREKIESETADYRREITETLLKNSKDEKNN